MWAFSIAPWRSSLMWPMDLPPRTGVLTAMALPPVEVSLRTWKDSTIAPTFARDAAGTLDTNLTHCATWPSWNSRTISLMFSAPTCMQVFSPTLDFPSRLHVLRNSVTTMNLRLLSTSTWARWWHHRSMADFLALYSSVLASGTNSLLASLMTSSYIGLRDAFILTDSVWTPAIRDIAIFDSSSSGTRSGASKQFCMMMLETLASTLLMPAWPTCRHLLSTLVVGFLLHSTLSKAIHDALIFWVVKSATCLQVMSRTASLGLLLFLGAVLSEVSMGMIVAAAHHGSANDKASRGSTPRNDIGAGLLLPEKRGDWELQP
mmetsp:Transcript_95635/g.270701  ORF Transcript_95635/g.270701 Transcript_95635/m.270701 type:complete len:318 (+) Transcript_95635:396-1349(+)